jgi:hypothetical protein
MKPGQTNLGKKEQRQINQALTEAAKGNAAKQRALEKRHVAKQHRIKGPVKS